MQPHIRRLAPPLVLVALIALVACGGGSSKSAATTTTETPTTTEAPTTTTIDPAAEKAVVSTLAVDFFAAFGAKDADGAAALLENGEANKPKIVHCANLADTLKGIEMKDVTFDGAEKATLTYDIMGPDGPLVAGSQGAAIKIDGTWKIAETTFLSLYDAAKDSCTGPVPPG